MKRIQTGLLLLFIIVLSACSDQSGAATPIYAKLDRHNFLLILASTEIIMDVISDTTNYSSPVSEPGYTAVFEQQTNINTNTTVYDGTVLFNRYHIDLDDYDIYLSGTVDTAYTYYRDPSSEIDDFDLNISLTVSGDYTNTLSGDFEFIFNENNVTDEETYTGSGMFKIDNAIYQVTDFLDILQYWFKDNYENDDTPASSNELLPDVSQDHTIHRMENVEDSNPDWYHFDVTVGNTYTITTSSWSSFSVDCDTEIHLYRDDTTLIAEDDDGGTDDFSQIVWTADTTGTVYLLVNEDNNNGAGDYTVMYSVQ